MNRNHFHPAPAETIWRVPARLDGATEPRVLVVDDDVRASCALALALDSTGFATKTSHTGLDALQAVRKWRPGAVLLDLSMPLGDGWEVAQAVRTFDADVFMIAYTCFTTQQEWTRSREAGMDAYFIKPCNFDRLFAVLAKRFTV